jgi:hypothetical protein
LITFHKLPDKRHGAITHLRHEKKIIGFLCWTAQDMWNIFGCGPWKSTVLGDYVFLGAVLYAGITPQRVMD